MLWVTHIWNLLQGFGCSKVVDTDLYVAPGDKDKDGHNLII